MDRRVRVLALFLVACFALLLAQLTNLQIASAPRLLANPDQVALLTPADPYSQPRGDIVTADGVIVAKSVASNDSVGEQRVYPYGSLFADITGFYDVIDHTSTGVENAYSAELGEHQSAANTLRQILTEQLGTDNVVLTIRADLQRVAEQALAGKQGAIVAIDPRDGSILAMYGNPTFDPNLMASHDQKTVTHTYAVDYKDVPVAEDAPLTNQATDHTYAPGSTMKVITTAAIYDHYPADITKIWPQLTQTKLPESNLLLHNFGFERCGGNLVQILTVSCDTAYALAGIDIGAANLVAEAESFGFNKTPPIDDNNVFGSPDAAAPSIPAPGQISGALTAYSAIGQLDDQQSALGDALVAAGIGNDGAIMAPHLMSHILDGTGSVVESYSPHIWLQATSQATAEAVRSAMVNVALAGTAAGLFPPADDIAAKTGTAETTGSCTANWLIATGPAGPNDTPRVAVAAVIPAQAGVSCGSESVTGATIAGPAVAKLMVAALAATR
jgi:penicillin-binding protein A